MRQTSLETCPPRFVSPDLGLPSRLASYEALAGELGISLVWWQAMLLHRLTQYHPDTGVPVYRDATITLPRQQGKSVMTMLLVLERMLLRNQSSLFAAQNVADVIAFWQGFPWQQMTASGFADKYNLRTIKRLGYLVLVNDLTKVEMRTIAANSKSSGHGATVPLVVLDEAWAMTEVLEDGVRPVMRTFDDALLLAISTAGDSSSIYFREKVERGREAAQEGLDHTIFFAEWAAADEEDVNDEATWWRCMPSLGHTVSVDVIRQEHRTSNEFAWRRAGTNQWLGTVSDPPLHPTDWLACETSQSVEFGAPMVLALHAPPGGAYWVGVAADDTGNAALIDQRTNWDALIEEVGNALTNRPDIAEIVVDVSSPIGAFVDELAATCALHKRTLRTLSARDVDLACGYLAEECGAHRLRVERHKLLTDANRVAQRKWKGNLWRIEQVSDEYDVAALYGLAFAVASARQYEARQPAAPRSAVLFVEGDDDGEMDAEWEALLRGEVLEDGVV